MYGQLKHGGRWRIHEDLIQYFVRLFVKFNIGYGEVLNAPAWWWGSWRGVEVYGVVLKAIQWS
jgi:hypothetical protein